MLASTDPIPPWPVLAPDLDDNFTNGPDPRWWVPHYLPHWTVPDRSQARMRTGIDGLHLLIEEDQLDWRLEDAPLRVSNLQTGTFSGPALSLRGTHRHRRELTVRSPQALRLLFAPSAGRIEITVSASTDEGCMTAAWLVGTEHLAPEQSGEICVFEIDADAVGPTTTARCGIKAHHDSALRTDMTEVMLAADAARPHTWTVIWGDGQTLIGCEGSVVRRLSQAPDYPMFLMLDLFEVGTPGGTYPKSAVVHRVRGWAFPPHG